MRIIAYFKFVILSIPLYLTTSCSDVPDFYLLNDKGYHIEDYRGRWLIVNFWAEWCAPCRKEIPDLNQLYAISEQDKLAVIGVSYDPLDNEKIRQIVMEWKIQYPVMATKPVPILPFSLPNTLPANYIIDPDGNLVSKLSGTQTYDSLTKSLKILRNKRQQSQ